MLSPCTTSGPASPALPSSPASRRRSTLFTRATSTRGLNGLVT